MFFRMAITPDRSDLVGVVLMDGQVYWRAKEVGQFLNYKNVYGFAQRHGKIRLHNNMPLSMKFLVKDAFLMSTDELLVRMIRSRNFCSLTMKAIWEMGELKEYVPTTISMCPETCPRIQVAWNDEESMSYSIQEWIQEFKDKVIEFFNGDGKVSEKPGEWVIDTDNLPAKIVLKSGGTSFNYVFQPIDQ